jgi:predicted metal-dependent enzyme (double-stranded beta helix superfamily)
MTLTLDRTPAATQWLDDTLDLLRWAIIHARNPGQPAVEVAAALDGRLPGIDIVTEAARRGSPNGYQQHLLHVEPGGTFSITALVWRPGQATSIHDHVCWCAVGVLAGVENEVQYEQRTVHGRRMLVEHERRRSFPGEVSGFAPPGDIHQVGNSGPGMAMSLHVYGADISDLGTSVRRVYRHDQHRRDQNHSGAQPAPGPRTGFFRHR